LHLLKFNFVKELVFIFRLYTTTKHKAKCKSVDKCTIEAIKNITLKKEKNLVH